MAGPEASDIEVTGQDSVPPTGMAREWSLDGEAVEEPDPLLRERTAAVLIERLDDGTLLVMAPEAGGGVRSMGASELSAAYAGHAIVLRPDLSRRTRSEAAEIARPKGRMRHRWETSVALSARTSMRARLISMVALNVTATLTQLSTIGIVVYGVILIREGSLTVGALIACVLLAGRTLAPLFQVAQFLTRLNQARISLGTLNQAMAMPVERSTQRSYLHRPRLDGRIAFQDVSFRYPGAPVAAIQGASFAIESGERVGIIGRVGSGKSTLHKLLLGLYEPDDGSILLDGTESRQIDPVDLRRNIGCVPQEVVLFRGTIRENIAIGSPQASDAAVLRAAELATADDFVSRHPTGYDRPVGERGELLSGGQRQAIAAARAILHEPPIVLLDEPTSSMDSSTEARFKKNLDEAIAGKTLISYHPPRLALVARRPVDCARGRCGGCRRAQGRRAPGHRRRQGLDSRGTLSTVARRQRADLAFTAELRAAARSRPRLGASFLLVTIIAFLVAAIVWADQARLDEAARGIGRVIPSSQIQIVQNLEGGILSQILASEGEIVETGQVLLRIDDTSLGASLRENQARYFALRAKIARLEGEVEGATPSFPADVEADLAADEMALYRSRRAELDAAVEILEQQVVQRRQELVELDARVVQLEESHRLAAEELGIMEPLVAEGVTSRVEVLRLERQVNDIEGELSRAGWRSRGYNQAWPRPSGAPPSGARPIAARRSRNSTKRGCGCASWPRRPALPRTRCGGPRYARRFTVRSSVCSSPRSAASSSREWTLSRSCR